MEIAVEQTSNLGRKIKVTVAADVIQKAINERLQKAAKTIRLDGFRPGKVPVGVVKSRFGEAIREEVQQEQIRATLQEALQQESLQPAGVPNIEIISGQLGGPLEYEVLFDVFPTLEVVDITGVEIAKEVAEIKDVDVERMLKRLREQHTHWEDSDKAAEEGDKVIIDFEGSIDGVLFNGGSAQDISLQLGSKSMIPGFEDQLIGSKADDSLEINVTFPESYHVEDLRNKAAVFKTQVKAVKAKKLPTLDEKFAESLGIMTGGMTRLREELKKNMQRDSQAAEYNAFKRCVMDKLLELNQFELPQTLVNQEIQALQTQALNRIRHQLQAFVHDASQLDQLAKLQDTDVEQLRKNAQRRVALGILLSEFIKREALELDRERVSRKIQEMASLYEDPREFIATILRDKNQMAEIEGLVMEDQLIDHLASKANIYEVSTSYDKIVLQEEM